MSDIRYNGWLHRSGTGGVYQDSSGNVGIGTSVGMTSLINSGPNALTFGTGTTPAERFRIDSSGRVLIGTTTEGESTLDDLTIATSGDTGMTIRSGTSSNGAIGFSDGTSGADEYRGLIDYDHNGNYFRFYTDASERFRINSGGQISIKGSSSSFDTTGDLDSLQIYYETDSGQASIGPYSSGGSTHLSFYTNASAAAAVEKLRIASDGKIGIGTLGNTSPTASLSFQTGASGEYFLDVKGTSTKQFGFFYDQGSWNSSIFRIDEFNDSGTATPRIAINGEAVSMGDLAYNEGHVLNLVSNGYDGLGVYRHSNNASTPLITLGKSRGSTGGSTTVVQNDDYLGRIAFKGADGDEMHVAATIDCQVDDTPGNNDMPGRIVFQTTPNGSTTLAERLRIDSSGNVGILGLGASATAGTGEIAWPTAAPLHVKYYSNTASSTTGSYGQYIDNYVGSDISQQKTWIGMAFHDDNENNRPQVKFGGEVGQRGDANTVALEGSGNFVVYTATGNSNYDDNATEKFVVKWNGDASLTGSLSEGSDARLKDNVATISGALNKVKQLRGIQYTWNSTAINNVGLSTFVGTQLGVIADEVESVVPEVVINNGIKGVDDTFYKAVSYDRLVPLLIESIKELTAKVEALESA